MASRCATHAASSRSQGSWCRFTADCTASDICRTPLTYTATSSASLVSKWQYSEPGCMPTACAMSRMDVPSKPRVRNRRADASSTWGCRLSTWEFLSVAIASAVYQTIVCLLQPAPVQDGPGLRPHREVVEHLAHTLGVAREVFGLDLFGVGFRKARQRDGAIERFHLDGAGVHGLVVDEFGLDRSGDCGVVHIGSHGFLVTDDGTAAGDKGGAGQDGECERQEIF